MEKLKSVDTKKILSALREFCPNLPSTGFIAGGAVAGMINYMVRGIKNVPIRDVDYFLHSDPIVGESQHFLPTNVDHAYFRRIEDTGYYVVKTERQGNLNKVYCTASIEGFEDEVLSGFDINACGAGIDLATAKLFYTGGFEEFLKTGRIHVTNLGTP
jgi:hypothetical protein